MIIDRFVWCGQSLHYWVLSLTGDPNLSSYSPDFVRKVERLLRQCLSCAEAGVDIGAVEQEEVDYIRQILSALTSRLSVPGDWWFS